MTSSLCPSLQKVRCFGAHKPFYAAYHDDEWGIPEHRDEKLFELLILEGAQAGLSWEIILKRREGYRAAFFGFNAQKIARMTDEELEERLLDPAIIRNRLKIWSVRKNAQSFLAIQQEFGSFDRYLWAFVKGVPIVHHFNSLKEVPCQSLESDALSKDLRKRGMTFVGSKIVYSFMQAVGLVDDHLTSCWKRKTCANNSK